MGNEEEVLAAFVILAACSRRVDYIMADVVSYMFQLKTQMITPSNTSLRGLVPANLHSAFPVWWRRVTRLLVWEVLKPQHPVSSPSTLFLGWYAEIPTAEVEQTYLYFHFLLVYWDNSCSQVHMALEVANQISDEKKICFPIHLKKIPCNLLLSFVTQIQESKLTLTLCLIHVLYCKTLT